MSLSLINFFIYFFFINFWLNWCHHHWCLWVINDKWFFVVLSYEINWWLILTKLLQFTFQLVFIWIELNIFVSLKMVFLMYYIEDYVWTLNYLHVSGRHDSHNPGIQATVTLCHCHRWSQWVQLCVPQTQFCLIQMFVRSNLAQTFHNHNSFPLFNLTASLQPLLKSNDFWSIQTKPNVYWISLSFLKKFSIFSSFFNS